MRASRPSKKLSYLRKRHLAACLRLLQSAHLFITTKTNPYRMLKNIIAVALFCLFALAKGAFAQTTDSLIVVGQRYTMHSKILNENRTYSVYLPPSYQNSPQKKYIVAYVLDGERSRFLEVSGIAQSMNSAYNLKLQIPELILVSIENTNRTRDFTPTHSLNYLDKEDIKAFESSGKANDFMHFIEKELMPEINKSYRTVSQNMIIGHSMGGLFALHCLLENPNMFSYYLLIDPSWFWDHNYIGKRGKAVLAQRTDLKARVFIALANNLQDDKRHYKWGKEFYEMLKKSKSPDLKAGFQYFDDEKHLTVTVPATYYGLRYIFSPYEINLNDVTLNPQVLADYEDKTQRELFIRLKPDERFVNTIGYVALYDRQIPDIAVRIFEINTQNYPESLNVWDSLADAYSVKGQTEKARMCYEKILSLDPNNAHAKAQLAQLK
jgi:hypothetical protein